MGQTLCFLRDKAQGKLQVRRICDRVFDQCADNNLLLLDKLHVATLMVYNSVNKQLLSPHKEPPSLAIVRATVEDFRSEYKGLDKTQFFDLIMEWIHRDLRLVLANRDFRSEYKVLDNNQFFDLIMEWIHRDLRLVLANRVILALLAAPLLAIKTKSAAMKVKMIRSIAEKVPTSLITSAYSVGLVLLQDSRVN